MISLNPHLPNRIRPTLGETRLLLCCLSALLLLSACATPKINLFTDETEPLREFTLQGTEDDKILVIPIKGIISDSRKDGLLRSSPSMLQETVAQLRKAEKDEQIKAVLLKIDSPGGTTTASDILYHELISFKAKTGAKVVAAMMGMATSGGYYVALPADTIVAHPTTVTGSIGALFMRLELYGLMDKIGVGVNVSKSGSNKDMGWPFRELSTEEKEIFDGLIRNMGNRFVNLVTTHRKLSDAAKEEIATARVYVADDALKAGLVDRVGYLEDALEQARKLAGLPDDAKVVVYRRTKYPDDNLYNATLNEVPDGRISFVDLGLMDSLAPLDSGFYYIWPVAVGKK